MESRVGLGGASSGRRGVTGLVSVSCPTTTFCAAVSYTGDIVTTTHPSSLASDWTVAAIPPPSRFSAISCTSPTLCVAVDYDGQIHVSTSPASSSRWVTLQGPSSRVVPGRLVRRTLVLL